MDAPLAPVAGLVLPADRAEDEVRHVLVDPHPVDFSTPVTADDVQFGLWWYRWTAGHPNTFTRDAAASMLSPIPWRMPKWQVLGMLFGAAAVVPGVAVAFAQWLQSGFDRRRAYLEACATKPATYAEKAAGR